MPDRPADSRTDSSTDSSTDRRAPGAGASAAPAVPRASAAAPSASAAFRPRVSPYCSALSSKKVLGLRGLPMVDSDVLDASNWCWCRRTAQILGPDRQPAHPQDCRSGRSCFHSPFAALL